MANKKIWVIAVLLAITVGSLVYAQSSGISLVFGGNTVRVTNNNTRPNDVTVSITYTLPSGASQTTSRSINVRAGQTRTIELPPSVNITRASVSRANVGL